MLAQLRAQLLTKEKRISDLEIELDRLRTGFAVSVQSTIRKTERCVAISAEPPMMAGKTSADFRKITFPRHSKSTMCVLETIHIHGFDAFYNKD
jgi:hypothetical protein